MPLEESLPEGNFGTLLAFSQDFSGYSSKTVFVPQRNDPQGSAKTSLGSYARKDARAVPRSKEGRLAMRKLFFVYFVFGAATTFAQTGKTSLVQAGFVGHEQDF